MKTRLDEIISEEHKRYFGCELNPSDHDFCDDFLKRIAKRASRYGFWTGLFRYSGRYRSSNKDRRSGKDRRLAK